MLIVSEDVSFDKKFMSMGLQIHWAFSNAIPIQTTDMLLENAKNFILTDVPDDHHGIPQTNYYEEEPSDGWFLSTGPNPEWELFNAPLVQGESPAQTSPQNLNDPFPFPTPGTAMRHLPAASPIAPQLLPFQDDLHLEEEQDMPNSSGTSPISPPTAAHHPTPEPNNLSDEDSEPADPEEVYVDPVAEISPTQCSR